VETPETSIEHVVYGVALQVALCEKRGKPCCGCPADREIQNLIHGHQQIIRTFLKSCSQGRYISRE